MPKLIKPKHLRPGARVAVVAPAFSFDRDLFERGLRYFENEYDVETVLRTDIYDEYAYFAGTDERRLSELTQSLLDPTIDAILAARGGYGCARIYEQVLKKMKASRRKIQPKIVAGFSDLTIFLNGLYQDLGWPTFHAPHIVSRLFREPMKLEADTFFRSIFTNEPLGVVKWPEMATLVPGKANGPLVGGCLSLVAASIGTSYEVETAGKILFLEDVTEQAYRLDRMLTQLLHARKLEKVRGVVFGQMTDIVAHKNKPELDAFAAIKLSVLPFLKEKKIPCVLHFPGGHGAPQATFPIGVPVQLSAPSQGRPSLEFLEAGTR